MVIACLTKKTQLNSVLIFIVIQYFLVVTHICIVVKQQVIYVKQMKNVHH